MQQALPLRRYVTPDIVVLALLGVLVLAALFVQHANGSEGRMLHLNGLDIDSHVATDYAREYAHGSVGPAWCSAYLASNGQLKELYLYSALVHAPNGVRREGQQARGDDTAVALRAFDEACKSP